MNSFIYKITQEAYFHGDIGRPTSERRLSEDGAGSWLLRHSAIPGHLILSARLGDNYCTHVHLQFASEPEDESLTATANGGSSDLAAAADGEYVGLEPLLVRLGLDPRDYVLFPEAQRARATAAYYGASLLVFQALAPTKLGALVMQRVADALMYANVRRRLTDTERTRIFTAARVTRDERVARRAGLLELATFDARMQWLREEAPAYTHAQLARLGGDSP